MKAILAVTAMVCLSSCASMQSKWEKVAPGQSKDEVLGIMGGQPDEFKPVENLKYAWAWNFNDYTWCGVVFDDSEKVIQKRCNVDQAAVAQRQQMGMQYMQMQQNSQVRQPAYNYNYPATIQRPVQTNCSTSTIGGIAQTNCSSAPSGIDTSIYGH